MATICKDDVLFNFNFTVKIWFQNRRMKWRNSKERELLANGGSRDQTLPNKNNPNPDLSDARTDRQQSMSPPSTPPPPTISDPQQQSPPGPASPQSSKSPLMGGGGLPSKTSALINFKPAKFELAKPGAPGMDFKYEFDDISGPNGQPQQHPRPQLINSFYANVDRDREMLLNGAGGGPGATIFTGGSQRSNSCSSDNLYYDEYESNSDDSDEEINVT
ncbi:homeobox protein dbx [Culex quinquefasciatus]|uniref:Homeobox protein dbx n=1 Tax=Culex quinquefasciatus TaxID=7176 RepID=B0X8Z1_CULQU|nr:homeobox protein dbx [Culex quinquefasciatus]|eukprot:XP_001866113.1 homeobox protein dbx [Culex quinquefasciatus]